MWLSDPSAAQCTGLCDNMTISATWQWVPRRYGKCWHLFTLIHPLFRVVPGSSGIPRKNKDFLNLYLVDYHILTSKITGQLLGFPSGSVIKSLPANAGDTGSIAGAEGSHMPSSKYKSIRHTCWACAVEPGNHSYWSLQAQEPCCSAARGVTRALQLK